VSVFCGVLGRLFDLLVVTHERYRLAVIRVIGMRQLESIVVDSALTATRCIQYLREQRLWAECFLPIDSLAVKAVLEEFRTLAEKGYPKVCLAFDVLRCPDAEVKKAAQLCRCMLQQDDYYRRYVL
jgi:chromosome segregation ATPase